MKAAEAALNPLDPGGAQAAGQICASTGTSDAIGACVVLVARTVGGVIFAAHADDLRRIDPGQALVDC